MRVLVDYRRRGARMQQDINEPAVPWRARAQDQQSARRVGARHGRWYGFPQQPPVGRALDECGRRGLWVAARRFTSVPEPPRARSPEFRRTPSPTPPRPRRLARLRVRRVSQRERDDRWRRGHGGNCSGSPRAVLAVSCTIARFSLKKFYKCSLHNQKVLQFMGLGHSAVPGANWLQMPLFGSKGRLSVWWCWSHQTQDASTTDLAETDHPRDTLARPRAWERAACADAPDRMERSLQPR
jgi:hypothetical protein